MRVVGQIPSRPWVSGSPSWMNRISIAQNCYEVRDNEDINSICKPFSIVPDIHKVHKECSFPFSVLTWNYPYFSVIPGTYWRHFKMEYLLHRLDTFWENFVELICFYINHCKTIFFKGSYTSSKHLFIASKSDKLNLLSEPQLNAMFLVKV